MRCESDSSDPEEWGTLEGGGRKGVKKGGKEEGREGRRVGRRKGEIGRAHV